MQNYLSILEGLKDETESQKRSWKWMRFWQRSKGHSTQPPAEDPEQERLIEEQVGEVQLPKDRPELVLDRNLRAAEQHHAESTRGFYHTLLHVVRVLERDDGESLFV